MSIGAGRRWGCSCNYGGLAGNVRAILRHRPARYVAYFDANSNNKRPQVCVICGRSFSKPMLPTLQNQPPDSVLITRIQAGESGVLDLLYLRHHDRIEGVIRSIVADPGDALDLTQEVFLKAYQKLSRFKRLSQCYNWRYRIAVNQCIDHMRQQSKHSVVIDAPFCEETFHEKPVAPTVALERAEFHQQLAVKRRTSRLDALPTHRIFPSLQREFIFEGHRLRYPLG